MNNFSVAKISIADLLSCAFSSGLYITEYQTLTQEMIGYSLFRRARDEITTTSAISYSSLTVFKKQESTR